MKRILLLLVLAVQLPVNAATSDPPEPAEAATEETPAPDSTAEETPSPDSTEDAEESTTDQQSSGDLRETVEETMRMFTPSEAIDVDKPVDFPTNI